MPTSVLMLVMQPLRALRTTCVHHGGLYQAAGAIRGTYEVHYRVRNSAGVAECEPVERTVVVQPCGSSGGGFGAACGGYGTLLTAPPTLAPAEQSAQRERLREQRQRRRRQQQQQSASVAGSSTPHDGGW